MKKNIIFKKISPLNIVKVLSLFLAFIGIWDAFRWFQEKEIYRSYQSLLYVFASLFVCCMVEILRSRVMLKKSVYGDMEKYLRQQLSLKERKEWLSQKEFREYIELHMELCLTDLLLGRYDGYIVDEDGRTAYLWKVRLDLEEKVEAVYVEK